MEIPYSRVCHWRKRVLEEFEPQCLELGKLRIDLGGVSFEERDLCRAMELAVVEHLGGEPNIEVKPGNDEGIDGRLGKYSYDVKTTAVLSNWHALKGWASYSSKSGRVTSDLIVCCLVFESAGKAEIVGCQYRDAKLRKVEGFPKPVYARCDLLPIEGFMPG